MGEISNVVNGFNKVAPTVYDRLRSLTGEGEPQPENMAEELTDVEPDLVNEDYQLKNIKRLIKKTNK